MNAGAVLAPGSAKRPAFFVLIVFLGLIIYSTSLHGGFCSDDYNIIVNNPAVEDIGDLKAIWRSFNTRFLTGLSFALNYRLSGLDTLSYHIFNFIVHVLNTGLVYYLVSLILITPQIKNPEFNKHGDFVAFFSALIFLCHPVQTQGVSYITQRAVSMAAFFYLSTVVLYLKARLENKAGYLWAAAAATLLGMLTKELVITVPLILMLCEFFFFEPLGQNLAARIKRLAPFFLSIGFILAVFAFDRRDSILDLKGQIAGRPFDWHYFFTEINVVRTYLRLIFLPVHLHHDYNYPIAQSFWEVETIFSFSLIAAVMAFAVRQFNKNRLVSFSVFWFFITILIEVIHPCFVNKGVIYEHWVYLSLVGFSIFIPMVLWIWLKEPKKAAIVLAGIIAIFCVLTYNRNKVWQSDMALWQDNIIKAPGNATGYFALGTAYGRQGDYAPEMMLYQKAIDLYPGYCEAYNNLAVDYLKLKELEKAIEYSRRALYLKDDYPEAYATLGACLFLIGKNEEARANLQKAVELYEQHGVIYKARHARGILERIP